VCVCVGDYAIITRQLDSVDIRQRGWGRTVEFLFSEELYLDILRSWNFVQKNKFLYEFLKPLRNAKQINKISSIEQKHNSVVLINFENENFHSFHSHSFSLFSQSFSHSQIQTHNELKPENYSNYSLLNVCVPAQSTRRVMERKRNTHTHIHTPKQPNIFHCVQDAI
jgi:hypothetical protein